MNVRRVLLTATSVALSAGLIFFLIRVGNIDLHSTWLRVKDVRPLVFAKLILLNALLVYLSNEKWLIVDAALRKISDAAPSWAASYGLTSAGMALGLILPVQAGMTVVRTLGTYFYGSALKRGTAGTLLEQSFDLLIMLFLSVASAVAWFFHTGGAGWALLAMALVVLAWRAVGPLIRLIQWLARGLAAAFARRNWGWAALEELSTLFASGLIGVRLARRLVLLSATRFVVVVLMASTTAEAIGVTIPLWHLAVAVPFVYIACIFGIAPGGLGVNELTFAGVLQTLGTPFSIGAQWALANRVLGVASCLIVALLAASVIGITNLGAGNGRKSPLAGGTLLNASGAGPEVKDGKYPKSN